MIHLSKFHPRPRKTKLVVKGRKPCSLEPKPPWPIPRGRARSPKSPRTLVCQPTNGQPSPPSSTQVSGDAHSTIAHWVADSAILAAICMPVSNVGRSTHGTGITEPARLPHLGIGSPQVGVISFVRPMLGRMRSSRVRLTLRLRQLRWHSRTTSGSVGQTFHGTFMKLQLRALGFWKFLPGRLV